VMAEPTLEWLRNAEATPRATTFTASAGSRPSARLGIVAGVSTLTGIGSAVAPVPAAAAARTASWAMPDRVVSFSVSSAVAPTVEPAVMEQRAVSLVPAIDRIGEIARFLASLDTNDFEPMSEVAAVEVCALIESVSERIQLLEGSRVAPWTSAPISDGGVQVEWMGLDARIDVVVAPDGSLSYMTKYGSGHEARYEEAEGIGRSRLLDLIVRTLHS